MKVILFLPLLIILMGSSCTPKSSSGKKSNDDTVNIDGGGNGGGGNGGNNGGNGSGSCLGTEEDGQGPGTPIYHFHLLLSGGVSWVPNNYSDSFAYESNLDLEEGHLFFRSDARLKVRFKALAQPNPPVGEKYCYNRETGKAADPMEYTKLKFNLYLRDVICHSVDPSDSSKCNSYGLGSRYRMRTVGPINVGDCSPIVDLGNQRNNTQWGTVVEIAYVKSDSTCQFNETHCPAEDDVRHASCWNMTMQVVTDYTQDFK